MSRRLRVIWKLRAGGEQLPDVVVAPVRALVQRLGPQSRTSSHPHPRPACRSIAKNWSPASSRFGYRREYQVEARGEVAVRGFDRDVYPATDDHPVRIDLWGDEVDRLSRFSVADQRSTDEIDESWVFPAASWFRSDEVRERAAELVGREPWGREQWERLADGQVFERHGVVASPGCPTASISSRTCCPTTPSCCSSSPSAHATAPRSSSTRRLARSTLSATWARPVVSSPTVAAVRTDCSRTRRRARPRCSPRPSRRTRPPRRRRLRPIVGDTEGSRAGCGTSATAVPAWCSRRRGRDGGVSTTCSPVRASPRSAASAGRDRIVVAPLEARRRRAGAGLAVIASRLTGRPARPRRRRARRGADFYDALEPGDFVVHYNTASPLQEMTTPRQSAASRRLLLLEYRAVTSSTSRPTGRRRASLHRGGHSSLSEWVAATGRRPARVRVGGARIARSSSSSTAAGRDARATRSARHAGQRGDRGALPVRGDARQATIRDVKADMQLPVPWTAWCAATSGTARPGRDPAASSRAGRQAGRGAASRPRCSPISTVRRFASASRLPGARRGAVAVPDAKEQAAVVGRRRRVGRRGIATHRLLSGDVRFKDSPLVVDEEQRFGCSTRSSSSSSRPTWTCSRSRHTDPRTLEMSLTVSAISLS